MKIMSSRYERRRERDPEPDESAQRSISPGPPRKKPRTDAESSDSRSVYQRPKSPSPPHARSSAPRHPATAVRHKPPETPTPSVAPHKDENNKLSPRLHKTPQNSFSAQTSTSPPRDHRESSNRTPTSNAPLKISSALATLSSSTALSSILSRTDGAENQHRPTSNTSRSSAPASVSAPKPGVPARQFDLAELRVLSKALQNHGPTPSTATNDNGNAHINSPTIIATESRSTHPVVIERSTSSLVSRCIRCFV